MSFHALRIGASALAAQSTNLDVTANNIANIETPGFKRQRADFADLVAGRVGSGVQVGSLTSMLDQGPIAASERAADLAILGDGFFEVADQAGETFFTRDGRLATDALGRLTLTSAGRPLALQPPIQIPVDADSWSVAPDGRVQATTGGRVETVGQLRGATFVNPEGLARRGDGLFIETGASGSPLRGNFGQEGIGQLQAGALEGSNVNLVEEMVALIQAQQGFSWGAQIVRSANEQLQVLRDITR
jgi:flagellar basal-body rod protein FlgG